jgi:hypothetical protein
MTHVLFKRYHLTFKDKEKNASASGVYLIMGLEWFFSYNWF